LFLLEPVSELLMVQFFLVSAHVQCAHADGFVCIYAIVSCEWLLMHSHMGVHACLICDVNFVALLPPWKLEGNSTIRGGLAKPERG
jgi:hypothetical protein